MPRNPLPPSYLTDVDTIRKRARQSMMDGPVTPGYGADRELVIKLLNEALATETVCWLRYRHHAFVAQGFRAEVAAAEFREHAMQELQHAEMLGERIVQLGGTPDLDPRHLHERSHADYIPGRDLEEMIRENLYAERIAIESYRQVIQYLGDRDPTTRRIMEEILAVEEEHAEDMVSLLTSYEPRRSPHGRA
jgi:bacterioferritin